MTAALRVAQDRQIAERDRDVALAWHVAAFERQKRLPRLRRLLTRRKGKPARLAPAEMSERRRARIALLTKGLTLAEDIDPYERPEEVADDDD